MIACVKMTNSGFLRQNLTGHLPFPVKAICLPLTNSQEQTENIYIFLYNKCIHICAKPFVSYKDQMDKTQKSQMYFLIVLQLFSSHGQTLVTHIPRSKKM